MFGDMWNPANSPWTAFGGGGTGAGFGNGLDAGLPPSAVGQCVPNARGDTFVSRLCLSGLITNSLSRGSLLRMAFPKADAELSNPDLVDLLLLYYIFIVSYYRLDPDCIGVFYPSQNLRACRFYYVNFSIWPGRPSVQYDNSDVPPRGPLKGSDYVLLDLMKL
jgi:hypothetical protein